MSKLNKVKKKQALIKSLCIRKNLNISEILISIFWSFVDNVYSWSQEVIVICTVLPMAKVTSDYKHACNKLGEVEYCNIQLRSCQTLMRVDECWKSHDFA